MIVSVSYQSVLARTDVNLKGFSFPISDLMSVYMD
jgi:hypothetical protein